MFEALRNLLSNAALAAPLARVGLMIVVAFVALRLVNAALRRLEAPSDELLRSDRVHKRTETLKNIIRSVARVVVWVGTILGVSTELGFNLAPLVAGVGVTSLAIGFGAQSLVKDVIAGFFIVFEDQFAVGDVIRVGTLSGTVEHMSLRATTLRNFEGEVHVIPNGNIQTVTVLTKDWAGVYVDILVPYSEDLATVERVLTASLKEIGTDSKSELREPPRLLGVERLGEEFVTLRVLLKTGPARRWEFGREVRRRLKDDLSRHGIQLPEMGRRGAPARASD